MLAYPNDPASTLVEVARVTRGPIILVQSVHGGALGYGWLRVREFFWTTVAFRVSKVLGYVSPEAEFSMHTRRFYTAQELRPNLPEVGRSRSVPLGAHLVHRLVST